MGVLAILLAAPATARHTCAATAAPAPGTKPATPLIARCATAMRVSPFGSLAFMLPDASRINSTERSAVLQVWASAAAGSTARHERDETRAHHALHGMPPRVFGCRLKSEIAAMLSNVGGDA